MTSPPDSRITLLSTQLGGGIGRVIQNLSRCFVEAGYSVDILLDRDWGQYVDDVQRYCKIRKLRSTHAWTGIPELAHYLYSERPRALITDTPRLTHLAVRSARWLRTRPCIAAVVHNTYSLKFEELPANKRHRRIQRMRKLYPQADRIIAVSEGVADDFASYIGIDRERIRVIHNPVIPPGGFVVNDNADSLASHRRAGESIVVAMGRLTPAKDFATLIRAIARARQQRPMRAVIFGEGHERDQLVMLAHEFGIADSVVFAGHTDQPYAAMASADVFVLSSRWEGFGNVLVEAMAAGTPVVSTDCPSGPREILEGGRWGPLVPVGDDRALAEALLDTLDNPVASSQLRTASSRFDSHRIARQYLQVLGFTETGNDS